MAIAGNRCRSGCDRYIRSSLSVEEEMDQGAVVFSALLLFGTGLSIAFSLHADIPNPIHSITFVYKPLSEAISGLLK